jgi:hypothetical protein
MVIIFSGAFDISFMAGVECNFRVFNSSEGYEI